MKGKLLIEPGFEAGSDYCGRCKHIADLSRNLPFKKMCRIFQEVFLDGGDNWPRCKPCLDAEKAAFIAAEG